MNKDSASRVLCIVAGVIALLAVVGVLTFAGPCVHDDGSFSTCHDAQVGIIAGGIAAVACALGALFLGNPKASGAIMIVAAAFGVFIALAPGVIFPLCMMETMRCHAIMQPFSQFMGIALAAVGLIAGIRSLRVPAKEVGSR